MYESICNFSPGLFCSVTVRMTEPAFACNRPRLEPKSRGGTSFAIPFHYRWQNDAHQTPSRQWKRTMRCHLLTYIHHFRLGPDLGLLHTLFRSYDDGTIPSKKVPVTQDTLSKDNPFFQLFWNCCHEWRLSERRPVCVQLGVMWTQGCIGLFGMLLCCFSLWDMA
jgi:hypothetical protein